MMSKVWFVTGASRGLGRAMTEMALATGHRVAATTRDPAALAGLAAEHGGQLLVLRVDVADRERVRAAVDATVSTFGTVDVVVNNAAAAVFAPAEDLTEPEIRDQLDVGFFGAVHVTQAAIPVFRRQRSGRIIQISSVATRRPSPGIAAYSAAKWALEGFSQSVAVEVAPFGVKVTLVEPGGLRTPMVEAAEPRAIRPEYADTVGVEAERLRSRAGSEPIDPVRVARVVQTLTELDDPPLRLVLGADAVALVAVMNERQRAADQAWAALGRSVDFTATVTSPA
jgi:NAD(P)-dependent dehydrogenase (short-subunit alcohol dehydrogenase family)